MRVGRSERIHQQKPPPNPAHLSVVQWQCRAIGVVHHRPLLAVAVVRGRMAIASGIAGVEGTILPMELAWRLQTLLWTQRGIATQTASSHKGSRAGDTAMGHNHHPTTTPPTTIDVAGFGGVHSASATVHPAAVRHSTVCVRRHEGWHAPKPPSHQDLGQGSSEQFCWDGKPQPKQQPPNSTTERGTKPRATDSSHSDRGKAIPKTPRHHHT